MILEELALGNLSIQRRGGGLNSSLLPRGPRKPVQGTFTFSHKIAILYSVKEINFFLLNLRYTFFH
jgi:hypothetical protein